MSTPLKWGNGLFHLPFLETKSRIYFNGKKGLNNRNGIRLLIHRLPEALAKNPSAAPARSAKSDREAEFGRGEEKAKRRKLK